MKSPQIDLNKVKEVLKKLSFLKNNLALLVPILIVIFAALLFIPTKLLSARLKNTMQQSVKTAAEIDKLIKDVNAMGQAEAMDEYLTAYKQDPCDMATLMKQTTMRDLLTYRIFPDTNETSPLLFDPVRQEYMAGVEAMLARLGAGGPPADRDIDAALERSRTQSAYGGRTGAASTTTGGMPGYGGNTGRNYRLLGPTDRRIVDKFCEDRARTIHVYASPADLDGYSFWSDWKFEDKKKSVRQSWYWQMAYWILGDVADTIEAMNQSGTCVLDSPVKRISTVSFTQSKQSARMIGGRRMRGIRKVSLDQYPSYVINLKSCVAAPPCTGRFCSEDYDTMHFEVYVLISADKVMPFIQELCSAKTHKFHGWYGDAPEQTFKHNQITVLESTITPIDLENPEHGSYRYGDGAVVGLDLICEYLFVKAGYEEMKPQEVKNDILGVADEEATN
ncbi:MAG: hypothetical protein ABFE01_12605 [Phycisphaerales bacterium]|jgi:hypothetical protein